MNLASEKKNSPGKGYQYKCVNNSILEPLVVKYYATHIFKWVPRKLTANWITLLSCAAMWVMLYLVFNTDLFSSFILAFAFVFLVHFYAVGDILDGMQAKQTRTSSPLGQFLDHYLDIYNSAICLAGFYVLVELNRPDILYLALWISYLAFAATMVEEKERGELYFGPIGSFEGLMIILFFFISWLVPPIQTLWKTPLWQGVPAYWLVIGIAFIGFAATVFDAIRRIGASPWQFTLFGLASFLLTLALIQSEISLVWGWFLLAFFSGDYIGRVMDSHLLEKNHPSPDIPMTVAIILMLCGSFFHLFAQDMSINLIIFMTAYMGIMCLWNLGRTLKNLKHHWLWVNP